jgi:hypothetical protein
VSVSIEVFRLTLNEFVGSGLAIRVPETIRDVSLSEIPLWVRSMGGHAVVKVCPSFPMPAMARFCADHGAD